jgi:hypothetical protein
MVGHHPPLVALTQAMAVLALPRYGRSNVCENLEGLESRGTGHQILKLGCHALLERLNGIWLGQLFPERDGNDMRAVGTGSQANTLEIWVLPDLGLHERLPPPGYFIGHSWLDLRTHDCHEHGSSLH